MFKKLFVIGILLAGIVAPAKAVLLQMDQGDLYSPQYYDVGTMGGGRGVGFNVSSSFHMSTLGINIGVPSVTSQLFEFQIFGSANGHSAGALLATHQFNLNSGEGWQDFAFGFDFQGGNAYVVHFTGASESGVPSSFGVMYSWEPSAYVNYGVLNVVEGFEGVFPDPGNPLVPHFRMNIGEQQIPEPAGVALLGLGLAALAFTRRKKIV